MQNSTILKFEDTIGNASKVKHGVTQGKERAKLSNFERFVQKTLKLKESLMQTGAPAPSNPAPTGAPVAMEPVITPVAPLPGAAPSGTNDEAIMNKFTSMNATPIPKEDPKIVAVIDAIKENKGINGINRLRVSEHPVEEKTRAANEAVSRSIPVTPVALEPVPENTEISQEPTPQDSQEPVASEPENVPSKETEIESSPIEDNEVKEENVSPTFDFGQTVNLNELGEVEPKADTSIDTETSSLYDKDKDAKLDSILNSDNKVSSSGMKDDFDYDKLNQITEAIAEKEATLDELRAKTEELERSYAEKQMQVQKKMDEASDYLAELALKETGATKNYEDLLNKVQRLDALLERKKARQANNVSLDDMNTDLEQDQEQEQELEDTGKSLAA